MRAHIPGTDAYGRPGPTPDPEENDHAGDVADPPPPEDTFDAVEAALPVCREKLSADGEEAMRC